MVLFIGVALFFPFTLGYRTKTAQITGKTILSEIYTEI